MRLLALLLCGCYATSVGGGAAGLALDYCQTRDNASVKWRRPGVAPFEESNMLLGRQPSTKSVDLYFAGVVAVYAAAQFLPKRWATAVNSTTAVVETFYVWQNTKISPGACGL
jgi:hypothetical protein